MNQFNTQENKGMLWSILQNAGKFNKLPANFDTQRVFENILHKSKPNVK